MVSISFGYVTSFASVKRMSGSLKYIGKTHNKKHNNPTHTEDYGVLTNQKKIASQIFQSARRNYIPYVEWVVVISYQIFDFRPILN